MPSPVPVETIEHTISFLRGDIPSLAACSLTCHALLPISRVYLWHEIVLPVKSDGSHSTRTETFLDLLDYDSTIAPYVRSLGLRPENAGCSHGEVSFNRAALDFLSARLPALLSLRLHFLVIPSLYEIMNLLRDLPALETLCLHSVSLGGDNWLSRRVPAWPEQPVLEPVAVGGQPPSPWALRTLSLIGGSINGEEVTQLALFLERSRSFMPKLDWIDRLTHDLLLKLLDKPKAFSHHISFAFVAFVLNIGYGIKISRDNEHYRDMLQYTSELIEEVAVPGKYLVDLLPALEYLPEWFPGAAFKQDAKTVRETFIDARRTLYEEGKSLLDTETSTTDSMLAMMVQRVAELEGDAAAEEEKQSASALIETHIGGSEPTLASLRAFVLAMAMYPDVQRRAQAELERVVGRARLPDFDDRDNLPYVNAVVQELTPWHVVAPIALPHATLEDDEYNGYYIPKGSMIIPNVWAFSRDPEVYPDPETFNPGRFLKDGQFYSGALDPHSYIFGFGRRICPGRHLVDAALFLTCASMLHAFNISPPLDSNGTPMKLEAEVVTDRAVAHLKEFECVMEPRWAGVADLIKS